MADDLSQGMADLSDNSATVRAQAAEQFAKLGPDARAAAVPLTRAAGDSDESVCEWATAALEELGPPATDDLPALIDLLQSPSADVAWWAVTLLGRLEEDGAPAAAALGSLLDSSTAGNVRQKAAWALGRMGPAAKPALPALQRASASTDDPRLARNASRAVAAVRSE